MKLEDILKMFGSEDAREIFLALCSDYYGERVRQTTAEQANLHVQNSRRAELHNRIMDIIQKLYTRGSSIPPTRKDVGDMIMDYFRNDINRKSHFTNGNYDYVSKNKNS